MSELTSEIAELADKDPACADGASGPATVTSAPPKKLSGPVDDLAEPGLDLLTTVDLNKRYE
ncbi:MAG: hypothetical protein O6757_07455, partial [Alphaproteobacteria bacterium]|nr:hypothetical protein [Alphaproteobacteria bacterium]